MPLAPSDIATKFIEYLESIGATNELPEIIKHLESHSQKQPVIVESTHALDAETRKTIFTILESKLGYEPEIEFITNPELIGGIRVRIKDDLIDFSIQSQVDSLFKNTN